MENCPPAKHTDYPLVEAATAIRVMGAAEHTGKLVLAVPQAGSRTAVLPPEQAPIFRRDGAYVITGGLGALGLFLAEKMATAGCGRIVLTSRSQPNSKALETIELIRAIGADVVVACGDITERQTAEGLVAVATANGLPLRGVLHAAGVVEDATLANITDELIDRDWAPKVYGAWHLHRALRRPKPTSRWTGSARSPRRPRWWARLVRAHTRRPTAGWTHSLGGAGLRAFRPARSHGEHGAEIGRATSLAEGNGAAINPDEGAYAFEALLRTTAPTPATPRSSGCRGYRRRATQPVRRSFPDRRGKSRTDTSKFRAELTALPRDEWPNRLRHLVAEQVSLILRRTIDPDRPLSECGLDSLGNLELRTRIETGNRHPRRLHRYHHRSRSGRPPVRSVGGPRRRSGVTGLER